MPLGIGTALDYVPSPAAMITILDDEQVPCSVKDWGRERFKMLHHAKTRSITKLFTRARSATSLDEPSAMTAAEMEPVCRSSGCPPRGHREDHKGVGNIFSAINMDTQGRDLWLSGKTDSAISLDIRVTVVSRHG
jgi:hypothetical protein